MIFYLIVIYRYMNYVEVEDGIDFSVPFFMAIANQLIELAQHVLSLL